jgi:hypothetical protein
VSLTESVFPWLLSSHCDFFHFNKCSYRQAPAAHARACPQCVMRACSVKKGKEGTGRAVTWRQIRAVNAFTMEVSFSGASIGSRAGCVRARARTGICTRAVCDARACSYHFSLDDLKGVGPSFCRAIAAAWCPAETSTHLPLHPAIRQEPVITRHTSHVTHHTSHVTRHTSHITHT